jgi:hypothetical protein
MRLRHATLIFLYFPSLVDFCRIQTESISRKRTLHNTTYMLVHQKMKRTQTESESQHWIREDQELRNTKKTRFDGSGEHLQSEAGIADLTPAAAAAIAQDNFQYSNTFQHDHQDYINPYASRYNNGFIEAGNTMVMNSVESSRMDHHHNRQLTSHYSNNQYFNTNNAVMYDIGPNYAFPQFTQQQQDIYYQQDLYSQKNGGLNQGHLSSAANVMSTRATDILPSRNLRDSEANLHSNAVPETHAGISSQQVDTRTEEDEDQDRVRTTSVSSETSSKTNPKKEKKRRKKKPKDSPRRPLSAYNLFFKDERKRILLEIPSKQAIKSDDEKIRDSITWPGKKPAPHGKIGFESLAKTIGARWRKIDKETSKYYKTLATKDLHRYAREMNEYDAKQSNKTQDESLDGKEEDTTESNTSGGTPDKSIVVKPGPKRQSKPVKKQQGPEAHNRAIMDIQPEAFKPSQNDMLGNDEDLFSSNLDRAKLGSLLNGISFNEDNGNNEDLFIFFRSESQDSSDPFRSIKRTSRHS